MQIMDHCRASHIEQVFALSAIAGTRPLPTPYMGQGMFDRAALTQFCPACWRLLTRTQLTQQPFIWVNRDAASTDTARTLCLQRTDSTRCGREVHHMSLLKRHG